MGFFDKLKAVKNMVTGGAAKVDVKIIDFCIGDFFEVEVKVLVDDVDISMENVYLTVEGWHIVNGVRIEIEEDENGYPYERPVEFTREEQTYKSKCEVAQKTDLKANKSYKWIEKILIPEGSMGCFDNGSERHYYRFCAGVDVVGNDPDSGWIIVD
ncbi:MAG: hypothetical protein COB02_15720 [Candidatus Cloacimonadota bacterium]|nr:MAG: hypothetical protein COB02_15720 [Candidatus Cloacimonadota bacterium]